MLFFFCKFAQKGAYMNNGYRWIWTPEYIPPFPITADYAGDLGTKFVDINGDGLTDLVWHIFWNGRNQEGAVINTGCGWKPDNAFSPPYNLASLERKESGATFVELNGDGIPDFVWNMELSANNYQKGAVLGKVT